MCVCVFTAVCVCVCVCSLLCVCVCVFTAVCVHLDGLNAEHKFRVWVTILGHTSLSLYKQSIIAKSIINNIVSKLY